MQSNSIGRYAQRNRSEANPKRKATRRDNTGHPRGRSLAGAQLLVADHLLVVVGITAGAMLILRLLGKL
jgi:hypothetical protein